MAGNQWARAAGLAPIARPPVGMNINTALPSFLQNTGFKAPSTFSTPPAAVLAQPPAVTPLYPPAGPVAGFAEGGHVWPPQRAFADGGVVSPDSAGPAPGGPGLQLGAPAPAGGMTPPPAAAPAAQINPEQFQAELQRFMQAHPQQVKQIAEVVQSALQSGQLSMQEFNLAVQLAVAAAQNPSLWPKLRQLAIQKGLATEQQIPQQYDQSLVYSLILAGQALQHSGGDPTAQAQPTIPQGPSQQLAAGGGVIPPAAAAKASEKADNVHIAVSGGEYVIPAHVVRQKGTDFFDKMIGKEPPAK